MADRRKNSVEERIAAIETAVNAQGGILERLKHIDTCLDGLKTTIAEAKGSIKASIWFATGFLSAMIALANWYFSK